jgi:hypothetical protein
MIKTKLVQTIEFPRTCVRHGAVIGVIRVTLIATIITADCLPQRTFPQGGQARGAIHQLLNIILQLRILVLLLVSTLPYVVKVNNYS